jgi:hypothetical protein
MKIITGADEKYAENVIQFIMTVYINVPNAAQKLVVYDLGLSIITLKYLREKYSDLEIMRFPYEEYPPFFNIKENAGQYGWKPAIMERVAERFPEETIIWMDSRNIVLDDLHDLTCFIEQNGIFTGISSGNVAKWTHPGTLEYMNCDPCLLDNICRNAACVGFDLRKQYVRELLHKWCELSKIEDCIAPVGSSRMNHRQDQAILTILFYECLKRHSFHTFEGVHGLGYSIHNGVWLL